MAQSPVNHVYISPVGIYLIIAKALDFKMRRVHFFATKSHLFLICSSNAAGQTEHNLTLSNNIFYVDVSCICYDSDS